MSDTQTLAVHIDRLMRRIHVELRPKALLVDDAKVGPLGGMVLMTIEENAPISVQKLAKLLARDKGHVTRLIQTLERKSLLIRAECPEDRRISLLRLSASGDMLVTAFRTALAEVVDAMMIDLGQEEREQFLRTLQKLLVSPSDEERFAPPDG